MKGLATFLVTLMCLGIQHKAICMDDNTTPRFWANKLADPLDKNNANFYLLRIDLSEMDSTTSFHFLDKIRSESPKANSYFTARYNCIKALTVLGFNPPDPAFSSNYRQGIKKEVVRLFEEAMHHAYITDDDYLSAFVSSLYGGAMKGFQHTAKAVMYLMYSAELNEKVQYKGTFGNYFALGELLWKIREFEKCIKYTQVAKSLLGPDSGLGGKYEMMCDNTIGLAYHRMEKYDSANYYYKKGLRLASELEDTASGKIWKGIILGNMAQINFARKHHSTALAAFDIDYQTNKEYGFYHDAANSLQWAAKTNLALGHKALALQQIREVFQLLQKWPTAHNYRQNAYQTAAEVFKSLNNIDSALYYSTKYNFLHDSLEKVIYLSSIDVSQLRLHNEKSRYAIQNLEQKKNDQIQKRNYIIAGIVLLSIIFLLLINRQRLRSKYESEIEHSEKIRLENEMEAAKMQMKMFAKSITEKTTLIEKLQMQEIDKKQTIEKQELLADLANQSILTEEDWTKFKLDFEKIHPGIFDKIMTQFKDITQAELRMGALLFLNFTTREIATVLGISPNSVNKTKQRLRQRFGLESVQEIENFIASL